MTEPKRVSLLTVAAGAFATYVAAGVLFSLLGW
jgi:hypothetical protein